MAVYVLQEYEKNILFRIPLTVYFLWRDPEYNKLRLVVKEFRRPELFSDSSETYSYLII